MLYKFFAYFPILFTIVFYQFQKNNDKFTARMLVLVVVASAIMV